MKEKILNTARELFRNYGVKSVTMDDISKELGISKKTLYQQFSTKNALVEQVVELLISEDRDDLLKITNESKNAIDEIFRLSQKMRETFKLMHKSFVYELQKYYPKAWLLIEQEHFPFIEEEIKKNLKWGVDEGLFRTNLNIDVIAKFQMSHSKAILDVNVFPVQYGKEQLFAEMMEYHLMGIISEDGRKVFDEIITKKSDYAK